MRASRKRKFSAIALATIAGLFAAPSLARLGDEQMPDVFAGVWQVNVNPDGPASHAGKQAFNDLILFEDGKMTASACASYGFGPAEYSVGESGVSFITTMSLEGDSIEWSGTVSSGQMSGVVVWTKSGGAVYRYSLSGTRQSSETEGASESASD